MIGETGPEPYTLKPGEVVLPSKPLACWDCGTTMVWWERFPHRHKCPACGLTAPTDYCREMQEDEE